MNDIPVPVTSQQLISRLKFYGTGRLLTGIKLNDTLILQSNTK